MISVIIPIYNAEQYLDKCLLSVASNTYRDLEIICVNDSSTDSSPDILRKWQLKDPRIVVVSHENRGLPEARNSGLEAATGEYTVFIDADDWVHPQFFRYLLDCREKTGADIVMCGVQKVYEGEAVEPEPVCEPLYRKLTAGEYYSDLYGRLMIWGKLLRNCDTDRLRFPREVDSYQDTLYNMKLVASLKQPDVYIIEAPLYYYLQRPDSLSRKRTYKEKIEIANWYVQNERDPLPQRNDEWGHLLLHHVITVTLFCRYRAQLADDREFVGHADALLRVMLTDMFRDNTVSLRYKAVHTIKILFPCLYRFRKRIKRR